MKVIILEDDRVEEVAEGHARNYLLPKKLAIKATPAALAAVEKRHEQKQAELAQKRQEFQTVADKLSSALLEIKVDVGEEGKLFGSVTATEIAHQLKDQLGLEIDKRKILLGAPLKDAGEHEVKIKLFQDLVPLLKVNLVAR
jgi:large subunit ribosomal protein L9